jgi:hypothetical protein
LFLDQAREVGERGSAVEERSTAAPAKRGRRNSARSGHPAAEQETQQAAGTVSAGVPVEHSGGDECGHYVDEHLNFSIKRFNDIAPNDGGIWE